jgi:hypothetical protein
MKSRRSTFSWAIPTADLLVSGSKAFELHEPRDAMYKTATFLVGHFWGRPAEMADGLGVLLLTWNQAHYRYGSFDFNKLETCIRKNFTTLEGYRSKTILQYALEDDPIIKRLFDELLAALAIAEGKSKGKQSPVAVAKALHLLAPGFFPLWDKKIATEYNCCYSAPAAEKYVAFMKISQSVAHSIRSGVALPTGKTLLKLMDEYNYSKHTKGWV